jgi:hypothetical protein
MYDLDRLLELRTWAKSGGTTEERFDFGVWARRTSCGTTFCLAGKVCADNGATFLWRDGGVTRYVMDKEGHKVSVQKFAADVLGLTGTESSVLFSPDSVSGELNERCALEFLDFLIERARKGSEVISLSDREAIDWEAEWFETNEEEE